MVFWRWIFLCATTGLVVRHSVFRIGSFDNTNHFRITRHGRNSTLLDDNLLVMALSVSTTYITISRQFVPSPYAILHLRFITLSAFLD